MTGVLVSNLSSYSSNLFYFLKQKVTCGNGSCLHFRFFFCIALKNIIPRLNCLEMKIIFISVVFMYTQLCQACSFQ